MNWKEQKPALLDLQNGSFSRMVGHLSNLTICQSISTWEWQGRIFMFRYSPVHLPTRRCKPATSHALPPPDGSDSTGSTYRRRH
jgi:hypothetical protein